MKIDSVSDGHSLRAWLEEQNSFEVSVTTAGRAALRVQPLLWRRLAPGRPNAQLTPLSFVWSCLTSSVVAAGPTEDVGIAAAAAAAHAAAAYAARAAARAAANATNAAAAAVAAAAAAAAAADAADVAADSAHAAWREIRSDCTALADGAAVWTRPLWRAKTGFQTDWAQTNASWEAAGAPWDTFARIYDDFWRGREPDWAFLERIVLIDPAVWEAGPEAVAEAIEIIDEQQRLAALVKEQREKLHRVRTSRRSSGSPGLGHNNPPESLSDEANREILEAGASAARALEELDEELHKADPSSARVDDSANRLLKALSVIANYCGQKLDLAVDTLIKWGIPAGGVWLAANYTELAALANGAKALAKLLGN